MVMPQQPDHDGRRQETDHQQKSAPVASVIGDPKTAKIPQPSSQIGNSVFRLNSFTIGSGFTFFWSGPLPAGRLERENS